MGGRWRQGGRLEWDVGTRPGAPVTHRPAAATPADREPNHHPPRRSGAFWPPPGGSQRPQARRLLTLQLWRTVEIKHRRRPDQLDGGAWGG